MKAKLIQLLNRTSDKNEEVVFDAIRKANKLLQMCDLTWEKLLEDTDPVQDFYRLAMVDVFHFCQSSAVSVNSRQFSRDLEKRFRVQGFLTPAQMECLQTIYLEGRRPKKKASK